MSITTNQPKVTRFTYPEKCWAIMFILYAAMNRKDRNIEEKDFKVNTNGITHIMHTTKS